MRTDLLPENTLKLFSSFADQEFLAPFYLTGGTALALQLGHRESEDLDFFTQQTFDPQQLQEKLASFGSVTSVEIAEGTLNAFLNGVKLQFLHYPYKLLEQTQFFNDIAISSQLDIACTKLLTISMRGSKKDFIDLYFLLNTYTLRFLFDQLTTKYAHTDYNLTHILKSLTYFEDAQLQPMPRMHISVNWEQVQQKIIDSVKVTLPLL